MCVSEKMANDRTPGLRFESFIPLIPLKDLRGGEKK